MSERRAEVLLREIRDLIRNGGTVTIGQVLERDYLPLIVDYLDAAPASAEAEWRAVVRKAVEALAPIADAEWRVEKRAHGISAGDAAGAIVAALLPDLRALGGEQ